LEHGFRTRVRKTLPTRTPIGFGIFNIQKLNKVSLDTLMIITEAEHLHIT
jgi:hypothetical protein